MGGKGRRRAGRSLTSLILVAALLLAAAVLVRADLLPLDGADSAGAPVYLNVDTSGLQAARVLHVVDGDTVDVDIDGREERVRYYGADTPERGDRCYREATERNRELVGDEVLLAPDARDRDRYGRLLRYVFTPDGQSVDATLIAEGLALAWTEDGAHRQELIDLEAGARGADRGCLWSD